MILDSVLVGVGVVVLILLAVALIAAGGWAGYVVATSRWGEDAEFPGAIVGAIVGVAVVIGLLVALTHAGVLT